MKRPTLAQLMADLVADADRDATDGVLPIRAAYEVTPQGRLVKAAR